ncbi:MAG: restriction endonuclease subunit S [Coriobacteriia bacterium]|nr:restriction endonuclease subunit S [Coriobacteriia bacterium]
MPPIEVQSEIVKILDNFAELTAELTARNKQYEYYRDALLNQKRIITNDYKLCDVAKIKNGKDYKHLTEGEYPVYGSGGIMNYVSDFAYDKPSVLIPRKGSLSNVYYVDDPFWNVDTIFYTQIDESKVCPKYFYHLLTNMHLENLNKAGGVPSLTQSILNKIDLRLPDLATQEKIVDTLDNFENICNDLNIGLPAEIDARQKQYEYFRDMLLSFAETGKLPQVDNERERESN